MSLSERLAAVERRYEELTVEMSRPEVAAHHEQLGALARERASLTTVVELHRGYRDVDAALEGARSIVAEGAD